MQTPPLSVISTGRRALVISFAVLSALGMLFIFGYWIGTDPVVALGCSVGFVVIMAVVHLVAYLIWRRHYALAEFRRTGVSIGPLPQTWRTITSIILMVVGTLFLLLLNGQTFTNALVFLFCWTTSLVIRVTDPRLRISKCRHLSWPLVMILMHVAFIVGTIIMLPSDYAYQRGFNDRPREAIGPHTSIDDDWFGDESDFPYSGKHGTNAQSPTATKHTGISSSAKVRPR